MQHNTFTVSNILQTRQAVQASDEADTAAFWSFLVQFEAYWSVAKGVVQHQLCFAHFDDQQFVIEDLYPPLCPRQCAIPSGCYPAKTYSCSLAPTWPVRLPF